MLGFIYKFGHLIIYFLKCTIFNDFKFGLSSVLVSATRPGNINNSKSVINWLTIEKLKGTSKIHKNLAVGKFSPLGRTLVRKSLFSECFTQAKNKSFRTIYPVEFIKYAKFHKNTL